MATHQYSSLFPWAAASARVCYAFLTEAICNKWLHSRLPFFLGGAEKASVDCGLLVEHSLILDARKDYSGQVFDFIRRHKDVEALIALDVKTTTPILTGLTRTNALYFHALNLTQRQHVCTAFIVFSPMAPSLVALVPRQYLIGSDILTARRSVFGKQIPLTASPLEPFPLEWAPFVMEISFLERAMQSLYHFSRGTFRKWLNPYNGLDLSVERPRPQEISLLLPNGRSDFNITTQLWRASKAHSSYFAVRRPVIQPSVGDLVVTDKRTGMEAVLELKPGRVDGLRIGVYARVADPSSRRPNNLRPFDQWDFLVCFTSQQPRKFFILSRDEIPSHWFWLLDEDFAKLEGGILWFTCRDKEELNRHMFTASSDRVTAREVDRIFRQYQERGMFRARNPLVPPAEFQFTEDMFLDEDLGDAIAEEEEWVAHAHSMVGRQWNRKAFQAAHQQSLEAQLRRSGRQGRLIYLGYHPSGSMVYVPAIQQNVSFHELPPSTPLVFVNISTLDVDDFLVPYDSRRAWSLLAATHGPSDSILILLPKGVYGDGVALTAYVLPSWEIDTPARKVWHQHIVDTPSLKRNNCPQPLFLVSGRNIQNYACPYSRIMDALAKTVEEFQNRLIHTKAVADEQFFQIHTGASYLKCNRGDQADDMELDGGWEEA